MTTYISLTIKFSRRRLLSHIKSSVGLILISLLIIGPAQVSAVSTNNQNTYNPQNIAEDKAEKTPCVQYESTQKLIKVRCNPTHLTDIYKELNNPSILGIENPKEGQISNGDQRNVWILDAGIVVEREGSLIIDSSDTSWLKITATPTLQLKASAGASEDTERDTANGTSIENTNNTKGKEVIVVSKHNGDNPNGIHVHGSLLIDSVKVTSWDPEKNDVIKLSLGKRPGEEHTKSDYDTAEPRAFIRVSKASTGTTNITNSEIAYLGYSCSRCSGISYYGGDGSVIKGNNIHHLLKGFYSKDMGEMVIEGNKFHDNYLYGIDPHTGSHHMVIRENIVYNNNASGIICSKDCHSLLIENNVVHNNTGAGRGISFSINTTNSVARNNLVYDNSRCIAFNRESNHNQVYNNTVSNCNAGIYLSDTSNNLIRDNNIINATSGIVLKNTTNQIYNNQITNAINGIVFVKDSYSNDTNVNTNEVNGNIQDIAAVSVNDRNNETLANIVNNNTMLNTNNSVVIKTEKVNDTLEMDKLDESNSTLT